jgi:hypothetical protein
VDKVIKDDRARAIGLLRLGMDAINSVNSVINGETRTESKAIRSMLTSTKEAMIETLAYLERTTPVHPSDVEILVGSRFWGDRLKKLLDAIPYGSYSAPTPADDSGHDPYVMSVVTALARRIGVLEDARADTDNTAPDYPGDDTVDASDDETTEAAYADYGDNVLVDERTRAVTFESTLGGRVRVSWD